MSQDYAVPALAVGDFIEVETEIKRSRFICFLARVTSRNEALLFQSSLRQRFPDATHHCLAFIAGPPEGNTVVGFDDDGEPGGTAGKPMLNVLQHKGIGELCAVVVRYFGGVKLGAGGLVRAYGASVQAAVDALPVEQRVAMKTGIVAIDYASEQSVRHLLEGYSGEVTGHHYSEVVELHISLPLAEHQSFGLRVLEVCKGQAKIHWSDE
ncbi:YigZ family protein [Endozoicomonas euniceicola]|uniref:YigZ family protein n=1 Tax=Endozoicomonas euniceicola TaxID=1234143 RepID=A0ABY6GT99_9GAMM|nr:YigZ family protein [Endozoicomonas euniceicola]UYM15214.1 YigZ family protein [Endozoicomonas euniceicola]